MTSSNEWPNQAIEYAALRIIQFAKSPLHDANFFDGYLDLISLNSGHQELDDVLPILIEKARKDKLAFITLKRICAHYEVKEISKPLELSGWLTSLLQDVVIEPKNGRTGPNKAQIEHLFLLGLTAKIASVFQRPIYPSVSTGDDGSVLQVIALGSNKAKKEIEKTIFPISPAAMKNRYIRAKRLITSKRV